MTEKVRYDSKRRRLRMGEYERANGRYEYRYKVYGKQFSIYARSLEELRRREQELDSKERSMKERFSHPRTTLNQIYELWKELKKGVRDNTYRNYCYNYDRYVRDSLGEMYLQQIRKSDIKRFYNHLADECRLKTGTIDAVQTILHQVLQTAADDGLIDHNPSDNATKELKRAHNLHHKKREALSVDEQALLLRFLQENTENQKWYPITAVLLGTGMRVGEATGLRWCDIDFKEGMIDVNHTLVYYSKGNYESKYAINDTKTPASKRLIPMTETVRNAFLMEKEMQKQLGVICDITVDGYTDFVFLNRFGTLQHQGTLNKAYRRIIRDCNDAEFLKNESPVVLLPKFSCHNLRHTFATRLCESGMNIKLIQDILGHSDISTTMDIYAHVTQDARIQARQHMEKYCIV